jgi:hypothetical protein
MNLVTDVMKPEDLVKMVLSSSPEVYERFVETAEEIISTENSQIMIDDSFNPYRILSQLHTYASQFDYSEKGSKGTVKSLTLKDVLATYGSILEVYNNSTGFKLGRLASDSSRFKKYLPPTKDMIEYIDDHLVP